MEELARARTTRSYDESQRASASGETVGASRWQPTLIWSREAQLVPSDAREAEVGGLQSSIASSAAAVQRQSLSVDACFCPRSQAQDQDLAARERELSPGRC